MMHRLSPLLALSALLLSASVAQAQTTGPSEGALRMGSPAAAPQTVSREEMWPAPTAADWEKPCLVLWERTFEDALAVAQRTGKPLMVCVNMDGEIASEHFAGIRYRTPEIAQLFDPYVCVMASVYRHTPRDFDAQGVRVPCPRFGTVTCGEHIAIEPELHDRFFEGRRVAPRHIMLELDGTESFDVYYAWDTQTISTALVEGVRDREPGTPLALGDRTPVERVGSAGVLDRLAVERAYAEGSREQRRQLIEATLSLRKVSDLDQVDLLRLAIFGFDVELARLARQALTQCNSEAAIDLIAEVLKLPMEPEEQAALLAAVERLGETYPRARTLSAVYRGLAVRSEHVDLAGWAEQSADGGASARSAYAATANQLEARAASSEARPDDGEARLEFAESLLARAADPSLDRRFTTAALQDARTSARAAAELGASGWRLDTVLAVTASELGDRREALRRAVAAVEGGMPAPGSAAGALAERDAVTVLALFAQARQWSIARAYRQREDWPPEWLADIHAAYAVLSAHPLGTDVHVLSHYDFLHWIGATPRAARALQDGIARFPGSGPLHERLRNHLLREQGAAGLESTYERMLAAPDAAPELAWFAGYASLIAAEDRRRAGHAADARAAYDRAIAYFERAIVAQPDFRDSADHYLALALAGRARIALDAGDLETATNGLLAAFERRPASAATADGLNLSPVDSAKMLRSRLAEAGLEEPLDRLHTALAKLLEFDPGLLELPAYERGPVDVPQNAASDGTDVGPQ